jgi:hypothetical protein
MIVVGGVYQEFCRYPHWDRIFGSGLRAAVALSGLNSSVELHGYLANGLADDVSATLDSFGIANRLRPSSTTITFNWLHPFEKEGWTPDPAPQEPPITVEGDAVLRFGLLEGDANVTARRAVYDPQSPRPLSFNMGGSSARELVIVANEDDVLALADIDEDDRRRLGAGAIRGAAAVLHEADESLRAILVKDGLGGLQLFLGEESVSVPTYAAESYFRIGAGDIIAAGFAHAWAVQNRSIHDAADYAARCVAYAMQGPRLPLVAAEIETLDRAPSQMIRSLRILVGSTLELMLLAEEAAAWVRFLGGKAVINQEVKEPYVTLVMVGETDRRDLLVELARQAHEPCVVYWPDAREGEPEHWFGAGTLVRDFSSALFRAMRTPHP